MRRLSLAACLTFACMGPAGAAASPASVAAPAIPFKREAASSADALSGAALGVLLVSAAAIGVVLVIRKRLKLGPLRGSDPRLLRVLETQRLGPRALISVIEFDGACYLVAQGEQGITCLAKAPMRGAP